MATANQKRSTARSGRSGPGRGLLRRAGQVGALMGVLLLALYWQPLRAAALAGTSFGARVACSCRYVAGRGLADCRKDFEPGMAMVMLGEDEEARSVTARIPLVASQTASYREGQGCVLEPWAG